jgi:hypothetical protein
MDLEPDPGSQKTYGSGSATQIFTLLNFDIFLCQEEEEELVGMEGFQCREEARLNILNAAIRHAAHQQHTNAFSTY